VKLPTAAQVIALHDSLVGRWGGETGFYDHANGPGSVESALYTVATAVDAEQLTIFEAAALLCAYLLTSHPFLDGNKRTATASMLVTLDVNNVALDLKPRAIFNQIVALQQGTERAWEKLGRAASPRELVAQLAPWLARHAKRRRRR